MARIPAIIDPAVAAYLAAHTVVAVRATPGAAQARLSLDEGELRAYVTAPPDGGAANSAVIALIAAASAVPKSQVTIVSGHRSRHKRLTIDRR